MLDQPIKINIKRKTGVLKVIPNFCSNDRHLSLWVVFKLFIDFVLMIDIFSSY